MHNETEMKMQDGCKNRVVSLLELYMYLSLDNVRDGEMHKCTSKREIDALMHIPFDHT